MDEKKEVIEYKILQIRASVTGLANEIKKVLYESSDYHDALKLVHITNFCGWINVGLAELEKLHGME